MTRTDTLARFLFESYENWKAAPFIRRRFPPEFFHSSVGAILADSPTHWAVETVGDSFEGRPLRLFSTGAGQRKVLLWSQMHGDEATATMAVADIFNYFRLHGEGEPARTILASLHLLFLPMLNPDGAARCERRTAQGIDMNRDAIALQTPEAQALTMVQERHRPAFAFTLHDQELSTVGATGQLAALSLLAPAFDRQNSDSVVRTTAKHVAATFLESVEPFASGRITRFDDSFEPRAFGDVFQQRGTSTLLVESGHALNDPEKQSIRRLNAVGLITTLFAIATEQHAHSDRLRYESLPPNGKWAYDIIVRNIAIKHANGRRTKADIAISYQVDTHSEEPPRLVDMGDLTPYIALMEIDGQQREIDDDVLRLGEAFEWTRFFPGTSPVNPS